MRFGNNGKLCQSCGRLNQHHTSQEVKECLKGREIEKQKRYSVQDRRIELAGEIVRREKRVSMLYLTREIEKKIPRTSTWVLEKLKKFILEEYSDIRWDGKLSVYYVDTTLDNYIGSQQRLEQSFSLSKNNEDLR